ncbi:unnamed protein product, partial [Amoebophrya sp. A25]
AVFGQTFLAGATSSNVTHSFHTAKFTPWGASRDELEEYRNTPHIDNDSGEAPRICLGFTRESSESKSSGAAIQMDSKLCCHPFYENKSNIRVGILLPASTATLLDADGRRSFKAGAGVEKYGRAKAMDDWHWSNLVKLFDVVFDARRYPQT